MHRLFWKLFLTNSLALILFAGGVLFAASAFLDHIRALHDDAHNRMGFKERAETAREIAATQGLPGLAAWAEEVDGQELLPILVLDPHGHDLLNRSVSGTALTHLHRHQGLVRAHLPDDQHYHAVTLPDGREYWLLIDSVGVTLKRFLTRPKVIAIPLALAALVSVMMGLLLAQYLAAPLRRLRRATQAYAAGDLSRRVAPSFGSRRDEIVDLAVAMDNMAESLDALLESKRALLRDISHELRSPLARVQAALGLARQRAVGAEEELGHIQHETERLNDLIGAILTYSRMDSGLQPLRREVLELAGLLGEAVESARVEADLRRIRIDYMSNTKGDFVGDSMLLYSAFENVLRNAVQHAPEASRITVRLVEDGGPGKQAEFLVQVLDQGPGVPPPMLQAIFQPFVRVDQERGEGLGLGLAISQRIIQAYKGHIRAENHPDGGLLVSSIFPCRRLDRPFEPFGAVDFDSPSSQIRQSCTCWAIA
jgi:two-component system sensor histidine kinase CpxA